ncbi:Uncharacterized protein dnl_55130 [Desulfonema limicola]|uniref:Outer membrane efflux protein n=1 Tax=Desulfonema limicola TaxID=45656 RepID=A0A975BCF4_9BACT|nr:hypothetical protein [Desulfonema limicola]QTA83119.1 Uncharacterized protein dnl_55130 [Desulfonema limicola]
MRAYIITIVTILGLCGCLIKPQFPETGNITAQPQPAYQKPPQPVETSYEPVKGIITLYEAMARAVKKNYTPRLGIMEKSLADSRLNPPLYNTLPSIVRSAGYGYNSGEIKSQFYGQASGQSYDNIVMWNILDYGLSFAAYTQNNNQVTETIKHKVMQNIIHEVRYAYYRTASAQSLLNQARELSKQARIVLDQGNESYGLNPKQSMKIHENKRKLIENVRVIWEYIQKMTSAKSDLGLLQTSESIS